MAAATRPRNIGCGRSGRLWHRVGLRADEDTGARCGQFEDLHDRVIRGLAGEDQPAFSSRSMYCGSTS